MTSLILAIALIGQHADNEYRFRASWPNEVGCLAVPIPASPAKLGQRDDPYAFVTWLNGTRRIYGLRPLVYDRELERWAVANNRAQRALSRAGHYVLAPAAGQAGACITGPIGQYVGEAWLSSDEHRSLLLHPAISQCGLAWDGNFWTLNVR